MGLCASSQVKKETKGSPTTITTSPHSYKTKRSLPTIRVINLEGKLREYNQPIRASQVTGSASSCCLCSSESMSIGVCVTPVPEEEELQRGHIYFLLPASQARKPLTLSDLCSLAVKASSALGEDHPVDFLPADSSMLISGD